MTTTHTFSVPDMSCQHCINAITAEVTKVPGTHNLAIDLEAKTVTVDGAARSAIVVAIDEAGFDVDND